MNGLDTIERAACEALYYVFFRSRKIDVALRRAFIKHGISSFAERGRCAGLAYGITRSWRLLWEATGTAPSLDQGGSERLLAAYGLLTRPREPRSVEETRMLAEFDRLRSVRRFRESVPDWLDELGARELGSEWDSTIGCLNLEPRFTLRANTLKGDRDSLAGRLREAGLCPRPVQGADDALALDRVPDFRGFEEYANGMFEVQDASSQLVSAFLRAEPGMRVVDACAGSGGKSLHLAALMKNRGKIIALDTSGKKLDRLSKRARRAGASVIEPRLITSTKTIKRLSGQADRLLLDVPCSGTGSMRRNPDTKWRLVPEALDRLCNLQAHILSYYSRIVKSGGLVLYANCSILPSEGEECVRAFLETRASDFSLVSEKRIDPRDQNFDGFYMALIRRNA